MNLGGTLLLALSERSFTREEWERSASAHKASVDEWGGLGAKWREPRDSQALSQQFAPKWHQLRFFWPLSPRTSQHRHRLPCSRLTLFLSQAKTQRWSAPSARVRVGLPLAYVQYRGGSSRGRGGRANSAAEDIEDAASTDEEAPEKFLWC